MSNPHYIANLEASLAPSCYLSLNMSSTACYWNQSLLCFEISSTGHLPEYFTLCSKSMIFLSSVYSGAPADAMVLSFSPINITIGSYRQVVRKLAIIAVNPQSVLIISNSVEADVMKIVPSFRAKVLYIVLQHYDSLTLEIHLYIIIMNSWDNLLTYNLP